MSSEGRLREILRHPRIWQAGRAAARDGQMVSSGWSKLDKALNGGWPLAQLTELMVDAQGMGEFALLLPALRRLVSRERAGLSGGWVMLVAVPHIPYAPALVRAGLDPARLLLVRSRQETDTLWAMEQVLRARAVAAVLGWSQSRDGRALRRLQLAAETSGAWVVMFRPADARSSRSPAPLRIHVLCPQDTKRLRLSVFKRRGGPPVVVDLDTSSDGLD